MKVWALTHVNGREGWIYIDDALRLRERTPTTVFFDPETKRPMVAHRTHKSPSGGSEKPNRAHFEYARVHRGSPRFTKSAG